MTLARCACGSWIKPRRTGYYKRCRSCRARSPGKRPKPASWDAPAFLALWLAAQRRSHRSLAVHLRTSPHALRRWLAGDRVARPSTQRRIAAALEA